MQYHINIMSLYHVIYNIILYQVIWFVFYDSSRMGQTFRDLVHVQTHPVHAKQTPVVEIISTTVTPQVTRFGARYSTPSFDQVDMIT